jgi:hypothetical protein
MHSTLLTRRRRKQEKEDLFFGYWSVVSVSVREKGSVLFFCVGIMTSVEVLQPFVVREPA